MNIRKEGLGAKVLSVCEGHEAKCEVLYISYRAQQILAVLQLQAAPIESNSLSSTTVVNQKTILYSLMVVALVGLLVFSSFSNSSQKLIDGRCGVNNDSTVTDIQTNLSWQLCSVGQTWTGETCDGEASSFKWNAAMQLAKEGWRLPTVDEFATLIFCNSGQRRTSARPNGWYLEKTDGECQCDYTRPTINQLVLLNTHERTSLWSSSPYAHNPAHAWFASFFKGRFYRFDSRYSNDGVRLVRVEH